MAAVVDTLSLSGHRPKSVDTKTQGSQRLEIGRSSIQTSLWGTPKKLVDMHLGSVDTKIVGEIGEQLLASAATWLRLDLQTCTGVSRCRERKARLSEGERVRIELNVSMDERDGCGCRDGSMRLPMARIMKYNAAPLRGPVCARNSILGDDRKYELNKCRTLVCAQSKEVSSSMNITQGPAVVR